MRRALGMRAGVAAGVGTAATDVLSSYVAVETPHFPRYTLNPAKLTMASLRRDDGRENSSGYKYRQVSLKAASSSLSKPIVIPYYGCEIRCRSIKLTCSSGIILLHGCISMLVLGYRHQDLRHVYNVVSTELTSQNSVHFVGFAGWHPRSTS